MKPPTPQPVAPNAKVPLWRKLYESNPYENLGADDAVHDDVTGWGYGHQLFDTLIEAVRPKLIVEVGSWKGASAIRMAKVCDRLELDTDIVCIDTWLGSAEHVLQSEDAESLRRVHGYPTLYLTFLRNVLSRGCQDRVTPLAAESGAGAQILTAKALFPDMIYIDAAHDAASVKRDLELYWPLLVEGGVLFGDDFLSSPGVSEAVLAFCKERSLYFIGDLTKFVICKGDRFQPSLGLRSDGTGTDPWGATAATLQSIRDEFSAKKR